MTRPFIGGIVRKILEIIPEQIERIFMIRVENLTKSFGDRLLLDQISFSIAAKQRVGPAKMIGT